METPSADEDSILLGCYGSIRLLGAADEGSFEMLVTR